MQKLDPNTIKNLYNYVIYNQQSFDDAFEDAGGGIFRYKTGIKNIYFSNSIEYTLANLTTAGMTSLESNEVTECFIEPDILIDATDILLSSIPIPKNTNPKDISELANVLEIDGDPIDGTPKYIVTISGDYSISENPSVINTDSTLVNASHFKVASTPAILGYIESIVVSDYNNEEDSEIVINNKSLNSPNNNIDFFGFVFSENASVIQSIYDMYGNLNIRKKENGFWSQWENNNNKYNENFIKNNFVKYDLQLYEINNTNLSNNGWLSVAWSSELHMCVAVANSGTNRVAYSYDGLTWSLIAGTNLDSNGWTSVAWSPELSLFIAVAESGTNRVAYSSDGLTWSLIAGTNLDSNIWRSVVWSSELSLFVTIGSGTNVVAYSYDGLVWSLISETNLDANIWQSIYWSPKLHMFVAVASSGTNRTAYSYDGLNWTITPSGNDSNEWSSVVWSPELSMFVAVSQTGTNRVMYSNNGISWIANESGDDTNQWLWITWSPELSMFVSIAFNETKSIQYSYNGIDWIAITLRNSDTIGMKSILWISKLKMFIIAKTSNILYMKGTY